MIFTAVETFNSVTDFSVYDYDDSFFFVNKTSSVMLLVTVF